MLKDLSSKELTDWQIFYKLRPFGQDLGFIQSAIIACVIANANRGKHSKVFTLEDFMPKFGTQVKDWEKIKKTLTSMATKKEKKRNKKNG